MVSTPMLNARSLESTALCARVVVVVATPQMLGLAQGAFDAAMPYIHQRKQFGQVIASYQGMQFSVASCATEIECARLMVYNAARLKEQGLPFVQQAAMAKLKASQVAEKVASQAVEWMGGIGFTKVRHSSLFRMLRRCGAGLRMVWRCSQLHLCSLSHTTWSSDPLRFLVLFLSAAGVSQREVLPRFQDRLDLRGNDQPPAADHRKGNLKAVPVREPSDDRKARWGTWRLLALPPTLACR